MRYTVSDFYKTYENGLSLIAGVGGLVRPVKDVGILDYELTAPLKDKYFHTNFHAEQLVLTTFLYARENPYIMIDAVKHLVSKGVSGLAIKNVFNLPIHDAIIRYADSKNFPIFKIESASLYFEDIIYEVAHHSELLRSDKFAEKMLSEILNMEQGGAEIEKKARQLNPSFDNQFFCLHFRFSDSIEATLPDQVIEDYYTDPFRNEKNLLCRFQDGMFLICSGDNLMELYNRAAIDELIQNIFRDVHGMQIGISSFHRTLQRFKKGLTEAMFSSLWADPSEEPARFHEEIGVYQFIFPLCDTDVMSDFSDTIIEKLTEYDAQNNSRLLDTLLCYIKSGTNIPATGKKLSQHEQTIRYRLKKIYSLTGTNPKSHDSVEQLLIAAKIHIAKQLLRS